MTSLLQFCGECLVIVGKGMLGMGLLIALGLVVTLVLEVFAPSDRGGWGR